MLDMTEFQYRWLRPLGNRGQFYRPIADLQLYPALASIADIVPAGMHAEAEQRLLLGTPVELFSAEDAEARSEPEHAENVLFGTVALELNVDRGDVWAKYIELPEGMSTAEYIVRRHLSQGLNIGQRALLALELRRVLFNRDAQPDQPERARRWTECTTAACRGAGVTRELMQEAEAQSEKSPDLAARVRSGELKLHEAAFIETRRQEQAESATARTPLRAVVEELNALAVELPADDQGGVAGRIREALAGLGDMVDEQAETPGDDSGDGAGVPVEM